MDVGIREFKGNLQPVHEQGPTSLFERLIASGVIIPPDEVGEPLEGCPEIRLPKRTAATLIDAEREEA